jgi:ribosomal protein S18 acetylase RimI-like enzyme
VTRHRLAYRIEEEVRPQDGPLGKWIEELFLRSGEEPLTLTFGRTFRVLDLPRFTAYVKERPVAFLSYAELEDDLLIVAFAVLPEFQHRGIGRSLIDRASQRAVEHSKSRLLVSTSNDNVPALCFYLHHGFRIIEIQRDLLTRKHGQTFSGIMGIQIRDEIQLEKELSEL